MLDLAKHIVNRKAGRFEPHKFEEVRARGGAGLLYDSLRRRTGVNVVAHRPRNITDIVQTIISKLRSWQRRA